ncbi:hypothetical protein CEUSTIGMA_g4591.t1 [Chlamydomonas eustigma]|uniref:Phosphodiesterase n=1 Tax=Chlamydomonas eustigma TaxID=1157962 RepID=A0A250X266_9CHLO|nr:hypothetical protein CEUSTIGMA_g4591.t1 [Chlamydomonas eustigma]|eukprot:GAX77145.1 hypothetical protein CEUSTIGMA_g4591.t1 [Chlamydomonas eustigma]
MVVSIQLGEFVSCTYGARVWADIMKQLDIVDEWHHEWLTTSQNPESLMQKLLMHTCQVVHATSHDVGRAFGRFMFKDLSGKGYRQLMDLAGRNLIDFIMNMNAFLMHAGAGITTFIPSNIVAKKVTGMSLELHYYSPGHNSNNSFIGSWVVGFLEAVARDVLDTWAHFKLLTSRHNKSGDHEAWMVTFPKVLNQPFFHGNVQKTKSNNQPERPACALDAALVQEVLPYHMVLDQNLKILQAGKCLQRSLPDEFYYGGTIHVKQVFEISQPFGVSWEYEALRVMDEEKHGCLLIQSKLDASVKIKGSLHVMQLPDGSPGLLYCGVPHFRSLEELKASDTYLSDLPSHSCGYDIAFMSVDKSSLAKVLETEKADLAKMTQMLQKQTSQANESVAKLKASLAEALELQHSFSGKEANRKPSFDAESPADKTLRVIEDIMLGEEVSMKDVVEVRDAIILSGGDLRQPQHLSSKMRTMTMDREVNKSLFMMLAMKGDAEELSDSEGSECDDIDRLIHSLSMEGEALTAQEPRRGRRQLLGGGNSLGTLDRDSAFPSKRASVGRRASLVASTTMPGPVLNILKGPNEQVLRVLSKIDDWQFDAFELNEVTEGWPLSTLGFAIFNRCGLLPGRFQINQVRLACFLHHIEAGYRDNPYHCRIHAADVLRNMYVILTKGDIIHSVFPEDSQDLFLLSGLLAAIVHDFDHRGVNNDFLVKTSDPLALLYNDRSPMENHHLSSAFSLLADDQRNFLKNMPLKAREVFRKQVIDMVLSTDMKQHFAQTSLFNTKVLSSPAIQALLNKGQQHSSFRRRTDMSMIMDTSTSNADSRSRLGKIQSMKKIGPSMRLNKNTMMTLDEEMKGLVLQMSLKCADLGHLASPEPVHKRWVQRLEEEIFCQGDAERKAGLPVSPLMDRQKGGVSKSQEGFFTIVAMPQYQSFCSVFPLCNPMLAAVKANYDMWLALSKKTHP